MVQEMAHVKAQALAHGASEKEAEMHAAQCGQWHQRQIAMAQAQENQLRQIQREATFENCAPAETQRRIEAMRAIQKAEVEAQAEHTRAVQQTQQAAVQSGAAPEAIQQRVTQCARVMEAQWATQRTAMLEAEKTLRKSMAEAHRQRDDSETPKQVRTLLTKRVRISGLSARPELNNAIGLAKRYVAEKGRIAVAVEAPTKDGKPVEVLLKPANLTLADADDDDAPPPLDDAPPPLD